MNDAHFNIEISLMDQKVKLNGVSNSNPGQPITFNYAPPLGSGEGFAGLELLVMSFAGCASTTLLFLLKRKGAEIKDFKAYVKAYRRENPISLEKIIYEVKVQSNYIETSDLQKALEQTKTICPVWLSLNENITVETFFTLKREN